MRVPRDCLVGEKDRGWYQAIAGLESERSNLAATVSLRRFLEELLAHIRVSPALRKRLRKLGLEKRLAQVAIDLQVMRSMGYAIVGKQMAGLPVSRDASLAKLYMSDLEQRAAAVGMQVLGLEGQYERGEKRAPMLGRAERLYLISVASTIGVGTSEIQRNIIATRGLGLPSR